MVYAFISYMQIFVNNKLFTIGFIRSFIILIFTHSYFYFIFVCYAMYT